MVAAYTAYTSAFKTQHDLPVFVKITTATTADWTTLPYPGFIPLGAVVANITGNEIPAFTYKTAAINNSGTAYSATDTSIVIGTAAATRIPPYYLMTSSGEIIYVASDSAPTTSAGTLTIRRGALGTTASATGLANTNVVSILNMVVLTNTIVGATIIYGIPLPADSNVLLGAAKR
jgi:hypothetical protein